MKISVLAPLAVAACSLTWALSQSQLQAQTDTQAANAATPTESVAPARAADEFTGVSRALVANDLKSAKALLQIMKANGLRGDQISRWENLAARTAVRLGDAAWLEQINKTASLSEGADELTTITAMRLIFANRLDEARQTLLSIKDPEAMSEIPRRRYDELWLKLEQLSGDKKAEAKWAGKLVEFVADWDHGRCQSCHANPKVSGADVTQFDLNNWWVGERYAELLGESGDAKATERAAVEALAKNDKDEAARIQLGYALRAQGKTAQSEAELRKIEWSAWPDKPFKKPLRLGQFP